MFGIGKSHHLSWVYLSEDIFYLILFFFSVFDPIYVLWKKTTCWRLHRWQCNMSWMNVMIWRTTLAQGYRLPISIFMFHCKNKFWTISFETNEKKYENSNSVTIYEENGHNSFLPQLKLFWLIDSWCFFF